MTTYLLHKDPAITTYSLNKDDIHRPIRTVRSVSHNRDIKPSSMWDYDREGTLTLYMTKDVFSP